MFLFLAGGSGSRSTFCLHQSSRDQRQTLSSCPRARRKTHHWKLRTRGVGSTVPRNPGAEPIYFQRPTAPFEPLELSRSRSTDPDHWPETYQLEGSGEQAAPSRVTQARSPTYIQRPTAPFEPSGLKHISRGRWSPCRGREAYGAETVDESEARIIISARFWVYVLCWVSLGLHRCASAASLRAHSPAAHRSRARRG
jgi:hypothetical protein